jgi:hypothetical protein
MNQEKENTEDFLKQLGINEESIKSIQEKFKQAGESWSTKENLNNQLGLLKHSVVRAWESMPAICSLSAMLLIIATFNSDLINTGFSVKIILSVLLFIIPLGVWLNFIDAIRGQEASLIGILETIEKSNMLEIKKKELKDIIEKTKKPTLKGRLPFYINLIFTIAVILIILLVWKIDIIEFLIKYIKNI